MKQITILTIFGTRPEAIKMCPLLIKLKKIRRFKIKICLTGQHDKMIAEVMKCFSLTADYNVHSMSKVNSLLDLSSNILKRLDKIIDDVSPQLVLVHGDTTSSLMGALAAFYKKIPIGHVEAGLRTGNFDSPFPEEGNRALIDRIAKYCFAPTKLNKQNLIAEGKKDGIFLTGNTVIDSFAYTVRDNYVFSNRKLQLIDFSKKTVLVTAHRRENQENGGISRICESINQLGDLFPDLQFIFPIHPNPKVRQAVKLTLKKRTSIFAIQPLSVLDMHNLLPKLFFVMTDSGGLQEEAPHFGKPVLVLRNTTERPEAVEAGTVVVCGTEISTIIYFVKKLVNDEAYYKKMSKAINPYGSGHASDEICNILQNILIND